MRRATRVRLALIVAVLAGLATAGASAVALVSGVWDLQWNTVSAGGGFSVGDPYAVRGVVGQPVAGGPSTAGSYAVRSGFASGMGDIKFRTTIPMLSKEP